VLYEIITFLRIIVSLACIWIITSGLEHHIALDFFQYILILFVKITPSKNKKEILRHKESLVNYIYCSNQLLHNELFLLLKGSLDCNSRIEYVLQWKN
jgi:hypothetical protein